MKKYAKQLKEYDMIDFDLKEIIIGIARLKNARRKPTNSFGLCAKVFEFLKLKPLHVKELF